jgi:transcriptional regulator with XRE-family HTH domain
LKQLDVARCAGITPETLSRLERRRLAEFGARKLLVLLGVSGLEGDFILKAPPPTLDNLRLERSQARRG